MHAKDGIQSRSEKPRFLGPTGFSGGTGRGFHAPPVAAEGLEIFDNLVARERLHLDTHVGAADHSLVIREPEIQRFSSQTMSEATALKWVE